MPYQESPEEAQLRPRVDVPQRQVPPDVAEVVLEVDEQLADARAELAPRDVVARAIGGLGGQG